METKLNIITNRLNLFEETAGNLLISIEKRLLSLESKVQELNNIPPISVDVNLRHNHKLVGVSSTEEDHQSIDSNDRNLNSNNLTPKWNLNPLDVERMEKIDKLVKSYNWNGRLLTKQMKNQLAKEDFYDFWKYKQMEGRCPKNIATIITRIKDIVQPTLEIEKVISREFTKKGRKMYLVKFVHWEIDRDEKRSWLTEEEAKHVIGFNEVEEISNQEVIDGDEFIPSHTLLKKQKLVDTPRSGNNSNSEPVNVIQ